MSNYESSIHGGQKKDLVHMLPVSLAIISDNWQLPVGEYFYEYKNIKSS